jgi:hypothetical protein
MNSITQMISQNIAGSAVRAMAAKLGLSEAMTEQAVKIAVPLILARLAQNAAQPEGAGALQDAVSKDHDGSIFGDLMGYIGNPAAANGAGILGHAFGAEQAEVQSELSAKAGVDPGTAGSILEMVAPIVMGAIGQTQQSTDLGSGGLTDLLNPTPPRENEQAAAAGSSDLMGSLNDMLDSNKDGSVTDDVGRILGNFMK